MIHDEYVEATILDLNDEWKPVGLVRKSDRTSSYKVFAFCICIFTVYYFVYYSLVTPTSTHSLH